MGCCPNIRSGATILLLPFRYKCRRLWPRKAIFDHHWGCIVSNDDIVRTILTLIQDYCTQHPHQCSQSDHHRLFPKLHRIWLPIVLRCPANFLPTWLLNINIVSYTPWPWNKRGKVLSAGGSQVSIPHQTGWYWIYLPGGMEDAVDLGDRLHTERFYPPADGHPFKYKLGRARPGIDHMSDALTTTLPSHQIQCQMAALCNVFACH